MVTAKPRAKKPATDPLEAKSTETVTKTSKKPAVIADKITVTTTNEVENKPVTKKTKAVKTKLIKDNFTFPEQDYEKIAQLKKTLLATGIHVKKNELLRAGLLVLSKLNLGELTLAVDQIEKIPTDRKSKK